MTVEPAEEIPISEPVKDATADNIEDLKVNTVDPAGAIDATLGHKEWLAWTLVKDTELQQDILVATGVDGTVYKIVEDLPPPPAKTYKMLIETPK